jgi:hypothetical protein
MTEEDRDVDPSDGRNESLNQRMDRNWNEILQELRVTQTGTQILSGFLLTIAFQPKFAQLSSFDKGVYLSLVIAATVTTALALAPVHLHRTLFRKHSKPVLVQTAHLILRAALVGLAVVITGTVLLIFDVATGNRAFALGMAALIVAVLAALACIPVIAKKEWARQWLERGALTR